MMLELVQNKVFSCVLVGDESLLVGCGDLLLEAGQKICAVVTANADIVAWAARHDIAALAFDALLDGALDTVEYDWLLSIANLKLLPEHVLKSARKGAVNFHDGPLPRYAGLNAPVWAILNGEVEHGITWHLIGEGVDNGEIVEQRLFDIAADDTAFTLNSKCYAAGLEAFSGVIDQLQNGLRTTAQDFTARSYFARDMRPDNNGVLDFTKTTDELIAQVRALDHGAHWNPLCTAKIATQLGVFNVSKTGASVGTASPGTVLDVQGDSMIVATGNSAIRVQGLRDFDGNEVDIQRLARTGDVLPAHSIGMDMAAISAGDAHWRKALRAAQPVHLPLIKPAQGSADVQSKPLVNGAALGKAAALNAALIWAQMSSGATRCDIAFAGSGTADVLCPWVPLAIVAEDTALTVEAQLARIDAHPGFARDLFLRDPGLTGFQTPDIAVADGNGMVDGAAITLSLADNALRYDANRIDADLMDLLVERLEHILALSGTDAVTLPEAERVNVLESWNNTAVSYEAGQTIHASFEQQVLETPDAIAVVFEADGISYRDLNARANQVAHVLVKMGLTPGSAVGIYLDRSAEMVIAALAILKAGGAYVPLDPGYPADRIAHYLNDSAAAIVVSHSSVSGSLPETSATLLELDTDTRISEASEADLTVARGADSLAYLIYTSGSTGVPKGVMVTHRNVVNFFAGMDKTIARDGGDTWLAVTSLSFDISVLELFYTLARGFKVVLSGSADRALVSGGARRAADKRIEFGLYYWGTSDGKHDKSYDLLLEGAKFADQNGFCAVWTPERHFHGFGGSYPNPSVTGAAVAAVTNNISVRAGSCVAPLHHPARIAEEWAVIDNMTGGRAGLAMASGWQPDDFVLRPENTPPANKPALFETIETVRKLWRGEEVAFPTQSGEPHKVITHPRPTSAELPIWVTTAGNPETWIEAGTTGSNILTHLLGQSIEEVADKIKLYQDALRKAGHDPDAHTITLMLHTYVGDNRDEVREIVREPMKDYLRSAAGLIKQYAWAFPAFKKPEGVSNPFQIDLGALEEDELEAILDFAFQRYFDDAGLFGTVAECAARADELRAIGVDEIGCLIDFGVAEQQVLDGLPALASALAEANTETTLAEDDFSIAAQIIRHDVTHLQCTPSMARMITMNDEALAALGQVRHLMLGGEALPLDLVRRLKSATSARIVNMYGPTETTIWSTVSEVCDGPVTIGQPIANTQVYVLDAALNPLPVGIAGDLYIAGDGVTAGYWQRDDQTAERFVQNPFIAGTKMYHTGDLARWNAGGQLEYLGRSDTQVKIRGHRIELGEIEDRLAALAGVTGAVVLAEDSNGDTRLTAYVTGAEALTAEEMRRQLSGSMTDIMIPTGLVHVDAFPLTPNKKIDRKALAKVAPKQIAAPVVAMPSAKSGTEADIARIWSKVLGISGVEPGDNFFALGGHSLLAVQAHRELRSHFSAANLSVTDIFAIPVLRDLAQHVERKSGITTRGAAPVIELSDRAALITKRREMRARRLEVAQ